MFCEILTCYCYVCSKNAYLCNSKCLAYGYDAGHTLFVLMKRIVEHIERLLLRHDCVIIPDFGGFVLQSIPAVYLDDEHSFTPSRKEIVFNSTLTYNDGLLAELYMQEYSADFNKAQQLVSKDVSLMKESLSNNSELQLGAIGLFIKEYERLIFMPGRSSDVLFSIRSYGLPLFHYLPLSARSPVVVAPEVLMPEADAESNAKTDKPSRNIIYNIPVTRAFLRAVGAIAAAILLFLFISTPVSDVNKASYSASFVPHEIMPKKLADDIVSDAFSASSDIANNAMASIDNTGYVQESASNIKNPANETVGEPAKIGREVKEPVSEGRVLNSGTAKTEETSTKTEAVKSDKKAESSSPAKPEKSSAVKTSTSKSPAAKPSASNTGGAKYYVIICSFENKTRTQAYIRQLKGSEVAATAGILVRDGRARGYAKSFSNENDANSYMQKLHRNPKHKDAWVYADK